MAGKGDGRRPRQVSREQWSNNYDAIFGKPKTRKTAKSNKSKTKDTK